MGALLQQGLALGLGQGDGGVLLRCGLGGGRLRCRRPGADRGLESQRRAQPQLKR